MKFKRTELYMAFFIAVLGAAIVFAVKALGD